MYDYDFFLQRQQTAIGIIYITTNTTIHRANVIIYINTTIHTCFK